MSKFIRAVIWLAKKSYWWVELDPAEDKEFTSAINASCDEAAARKVLRDVGIAEETLCGINEHSVLRLLSARFPCDDTGESIEDDWIGLMQRLQELRKKEPVKEEKAKLRAAMNLLNAYNRDRDTQLQRFLASGCRSAFAARWINEAADFCEQQLSRLQTGIARIPKLQKGNAMPRMEMLCFCVLVLGILMINLGTEAITFTLGEYVGFARNAVQRPRTLYQIYIALFHFSWSDGWFTWEIGRQRSLGAVLSFALYLTAAIYRPIYRQKAFVIASGVSSTLFQIFVQLGDIAWVRFKLIRIDKDIRSVPAWRTYLYLGMHNQLPGTGDADVENYKNLVECNARLTTWARGYRKSKSMSIWWMIFAANRAVARNVYAVCAGVKVVQVYDSRFWQKVVFPALTLVIWGVSSYATWGQWYIFTIINAFHAIAFLKGIDLARAVEQEVQSAFSTFVNMVGAGAPTLFGVLIPTAIDRTYLDEPKKLPFVMGPIFLATFWTDLLTEGIMRLVTWFGGWRRRGTASLRAGRDSSSLEMGRAGNAICPVVGDGSNAKVGPNPDTRLLGGQGLIRADVGKLTAWRSSDNDLTRNLRLGLPAGAARRRVCGRNEGNKAAIVDPTERHGKSAGMTKMEARRGSHT